MATPVERFLDALKQHGCSVKRSGGRWLCQCPAHDDRHPSLAVSEGEDGRALVHCFAGCDVADVCAAVGLRLAELMPPDSGGCRATGDNTPRQGPREGVSSFVPVSPAANVAVAVQCEDPKPSGAEPLAAALDLHRRGYRVVPVPSGEKRPRLSGWPGLRLGEDDLRAHFNGRPMNLGVLMGEPSGWIVDVDIDDARALALADDLLPPTAATFGRRSRPRSPRMYRVTAPVETLKLKADDGSMLVELRASGCQTIAPGSTHPSGEAVGWYEGGEPSSIDPEALIASLHALKDAVCAPAEKQRQDYVPFPVEHLPESVGRFVGEASESLGCDAVYVALPLLSALASAVGTTRRIEIKPDWREPCVLWTAIVGRPGTAKSPALDMALGPVRRREAELHAEHARQMQSHRDVALRYERDLRLWKVSKSSEPPPEEPTPPAAQRRVVQDVTTEAVVRLLVQNPRGLLVAPDELSGWFAGFDRYQSGKGGDAARWLELFGARPLSVDRKGDGLQYVPFAAASVTGGIQPEALRRSLGDRHRENGLASRLLLAWPPEHFPGWSDRAVSDQVRVAVDMVFQQLETLEHVTGYEVYDEGAPIPRDLPLTSEATGIARAWVDRHAEHMATLTGDEAYAWAKLKGVAFRLALVVHLTRWAGGEPVDPNRVDAESLRSGRALAEWFGWEAGRVYAKLDGATERQSEDDLVRVIESHGGSITPRDLQRARRTQFPKACHAEAALDELAAKRQGRWERKPATGRGGRPTKAFHLHRSRAGTHVTNDTTPVLGSSEGVVSHGESEEQHRAPEGRAATGGE